MGRCPFGFITKNFKKSHSFMEEMAKEQATKAILPVVADCLS